MYEKTILFLSEWDKIEGEHRGSMKKFIVTTIKQANHWEFLWWTHLNNQAYERRSFEWPYRGKEILLSNHRHWTILLNGKSLQIF